MALDAERVHRCLRLGGVELCARIPGARIDERTGYTFTLVPSVPLPSFNGMIADGPDEGNAVADLEHVIAEVDAMGVPPTVMLRAGRTPAIEQEALRLGLTEVEALPTLAMSPAELRRSPRPAQMETARVGQAKGRQIALDVAARAFEVPIEILAPLFAAEVATMPGVSLYLASLKGEAVATATAWLLDGAVGVFNVATEAAHRRRGYGRALTEDAVSDAFAAGADLAWLQASPLGLSVYQAMGFRLVETYLILGRPHP